MCGACSERGDIVLKKLFTAVVAVGAAIASESAALNSSSEVNIPEGWLLWHSYTRYETGDSSLIYSCTKTGNYDLYYYDGKVSVDLSEINTDKQELGAAFLSKAQVVDYIAGTQNKVLNRPCSALKYYAKGEENCMDLCLLRKLIN